MTPEQSELSLLLAVWEARARDSDTAIVLLQAQGSSRADITALLEAARERSADEWAEVLRLREALALASQPEHSPSTSIPQVHR